MGVNVSPDALVDADKSGGVLPRITMGLAGPPFGEQVLKLIGRVVVDTHLYLPDMVEMTFTDSPDVVLPLIGASIGDPLTIKTSGLLREQAEVTLLTGEVTAIEGTFGRRAHTVIRGYSADHRLHRGRRTRTFANVTLADVARTIATAHGWTPQVEATTTVYSQLTQANQTDWEFLTGHARALGYEFGITPGGLKPVFHFRRTRTSLPVPVIYGKNLREFAPRITAGNLAPEAESRVWDKAVTTTRASVAAVESDSVRLAGLTPLTPVALARKFAPLAPRVKPPVNGAAMKWGSAPSDTAFVVSDRQPAAGSATTLVADEAARGAASHHGSTFAEATGVAIGDPQLRAGVIADVSGVSATFSGKWELTRVQHVFESRYSCRFEVSGSHERSLLGLTSGAGPQQRKPIDGLVCAIVRDVKDDLNQARVRVSLPWLSPNEVSDWAPVVQLAAGAKTGAMFLPEVDDEVLVGFELGNPDRPYVLGGLVNAASAYQPGGPAVVSTDGRTATVARRGIVAPSGAMLAFHHTTVPKAGQIILCSGDKQLSVVMDEVAGTVTVTAGTTKLQCAKTGQVDVDAGPAGQITVSAGRLALTGQQEVSIESSGVVKIKGSILQLN